MPKKGSLGFILLVMCCLKLLSKQAHSSCLGKYAEWTEEAGRLCSYQDRGHEGMKQDSQCENGVGRRNRHERACRSIC